MKTKCIHSLERLGDKHLAEAGGKAVTLGKLFRSGLRVPPGFVIGSTVFQQFLQSVPEWKSLLALAGSQSALSPDESAALSARISEAFNRTPLPPGLASAIQAALKGFPQASSWAVRSSAMAEDSPRASFAGQHDSFLNVRREEIPAQVRRCWASLFSPRALMYRVRNQLSHERTSMAVLVQPMVPAEIAGVLFTADPASGNRSRLIIECARGLGDQVVGGHVTPERIVLGKWTFEVFERTGASADTLLAEPAMTRLAELSLHIDRLLGGPLDIEWAIAGGEIYVLQARPITGLPGGDSWEARQIWSNVNVGEVMPDVATPVSWSVLQELVGACGELVFRAAGVPEAAKWPPLGLVAGRIYMNANTLWAASRPLWFVARDAPRVAEAVGGGNREVLRRVLGSLRDEDLPDLGFRWHRYLLGLPRLFWHFVVRPRGRLSHWLERYKARIDELVRTDLEPMQARELAQFFCRLARDRFVAGGLLYIARQAPWLFMFEFACRKWLCAGEIVPGLRLFAGLGGVPEAEAALALWQLARRVHNEPALETAVRSGKAWVQIRGELSTLESGRQFLSEWDGFMREHGHHCRGELELFNARWSEKPDYILGQLRGYLDSMERLDLVESRRRLAEERRQFGDECLRRLTNPLKRRLFSVSLRNVHELAVGREEWKNQAVRQIAFMRRMLVMLGTRLQRDGVLAAGEDIFFLNLAEIEAIGGGTNPAEFRERIAARRKEYESNLELRPPGTVVGRFQPGSSGRPAPKAGTKVLQGIAVSPGLVTGRAKVVRANDDHERVLPGEILIAQSTDPAWTPYFVSAAGVAIGQGGMLSHGSVVAREFGLPAVTNLGPALELVRTGDLVQVDGNNGRLILLDSMESCATPSGNRPSVNP